MHRTPLRRASLAAAALAAAALLAGAPSAGKAASDPPPAAPSPYQNVNPALRHAPGYRPPADPESLSLVLGRRLNAPVVNDRFIGGARTLDDLGRAVCRALHHASRESLQALVVTKQEFQRILWREFPNSRPVTGLTADDGWASLAMQNAGGIGRAVGDWGGRHLAFVRWERRDTVSAFTNFRLHNGLVLVARDEHGAEHRLDVVRAAAERKGRYKLFAMKD